MMLCACFNKVVIHLAKILLDDAEHRTVMSLYFFFPFRGWCDTCDSKKLTSLLDARVRETRARGDVYRSRGERMRFVFFKFERGRF